MCDFVPGSLLLCSLATDSAASNLIAELKSSKHPGIAVASSMRSLLEQRGVRWPKSPQLKYVEVHRLQVPVGSEALMINKLYAAYIQGLTRNSIPASESFAIGPNLIGAIPQLFARPLPKGAQLRFTELHAKAKAAMRIPVLPDAGSNQVPRVSIVDSGIAADVAFVARIGARENFSDERAGDAVADESGHGTAVASIVHDLAPMAQIGIRKVVGDSAAISEWNVLAGLISSADDDVVQTNVVFGGQGTKCKKCGKRSDSSVPIAFSYVIEHLTTNPLRPVIVAPAGNAASSALSYPARLADVVAVGSLNGDFELSDFSNYGRLSQDQAVHQNYYVLVGGSHRPSEVVAYYGPDGPRWSGTCFAAAYATGFIAAMIAQPVANQLTVASNGAPTTDILMPTIDQLRDPRRSSHELIIGYDERKHGRGYFRFSN